MSPRRPDPRRRATEQALRARREALREAIRRRRKPAGEEEPQRRWWWLVALLILLWALLRGCRCEDPPAPLPGPEALSSGPARLAPAAEPPPAEPPAERLNRRARPAYPSEPPRPLPWIASFRAQVAARSPRLAACFVGAEQPGRLKWSAAVDPSQGRVSDHTLEPTLQSDTLTQQQRECVLGVLSDPPYRLEAGDGRSTPSRVAMVIEF